MLLVIVFMLVTTCCTTTHFVSIIEICFECLSMYGIIWDLLPSSGRYYCAEVCCGLNIAKQGTLCQLASPIQQVFGTLIKLVCILNGEVGNQLRNDDSS